MRLAILKMSTLELPADNSVADQSVGNATPTQRPQIAVLAEASDSHIFNNDLPSGLEECLQPGDSPSPLSPSPNVAVPPPQNAEISEAESSLFSTPARGHPERLSEAVMDISSSHIAVLQDSSTRVEQVDAASEPQQVRDNVHLPICSVSQPHPASLAGSSSGGSWELVSSPLPRPVRVIRGKPGSVRVPAHLRVEMLQTAAPLPKPYPVAPRSSRLAPDHAPLPKPPIKRARDYAVYPSSKSSQPITLMFHLLRLSMKLQVH